MSHGMFPCNVSGPKGTLAAVDEPEGVVTVFQPGARRKPGASAVVVLSTSRTLARLGTSAGNMLNNSVVSEFSALAGAGDWTATGWPATMEGAVRSGYLAAEAALARAGRPAKLVQPDLT